MVHDFPDDAKFLSDDDRQRVLRRLKSDNQSSAEHEEFKMAYFWAAVKDWKTWSFAIIYMGCDGALYAFSLFLPTIIATLGYEGTYINISTPLQHQHEAALVASANTYLLQVEIAPGSCGLRQLLTLLPLLP